MFVMAKAEDFSFSTFAQIKIHFHCKAESL